MDGYSCIVSTRDGAGQPNAAPCAGNASAAHGDESRPGSGVLHRVPAGDEHGTRLGSATSGKVWRTL